MWHDGGMYKIDAHEGFPLHIWWCKRTEVLYFSVGLAGNIKKV